MNIMDAEIKLQKFTRIAKSLENKLSIGMSVFLDANPGKSETQRFRATVQGWKSGSYLLLSVSDARGRPRIWESRNCVIRFMQDGEVFGFESTCIRANVSHLDNLVQFRWPREVAQVQIRKHQRAHLRLECKIMPAPATTVHGYVSDISAGGCSIETAVALEVDTPVRLSFNLPDGGRVSRRRVRIRSCQHLPSGTWTYGCQFEREHRLDHSIGMMVARRVASNAGVPIPHPQLLVVTGNDSDFDLIHRSLIGTSVEVVAARGVLDLGARLVACNAIGLLLSADSSQIAAHHLVTLIRDNPAYGAIPLAVYGGDTASRHKARDAGATKTLEGLSELDEFLSVLPHCQKEVEESESDPGAQGAPDVAEDDLHSLTEDMEDELAMTGT